MTPSCISATSRLQFQVILCAVELLGAGSHDARDALHSLSDLLLHLLVGLRHIQHLMEPLLQTHTWSSPLFENSRTSHLLLSRGVPPVHLLPATAGLSPGLSSIHFGVLPFPVLPQHLSPCLCLLETSHYRLRTLLLLLMSCNIFPSRCFPVSCNIYSFCNGLAQLSDTQNLG